MRMSDGTKLTAQKYIEQLRVKIEAELSFVLPRKALCPLRHAYEHHLHWLERDRQITELRMKAAELGYILVKSLEEAKKANVTKPYACDLCGRPECDGNHFLDCDDDHFSVGISEQEIAK